MPVVLPVFGGVLAIVAVYRYTFRRVLSKLNGLHPNLNVTLQDTLSDDERQIIKTTFLKYNYHYIQWIVEGTLPDDINNNSNNSSNNTDSQRCRNKLKKEQQNVAVYKDVVEYIVECQLRFAEMYGFVIVQRNKKMGNKFQGCICILPPYPSWWMYKSHYQRAIRTVPVIKYNKSSTNFNGINTRLKVYLDWSMYKLRKQSMEYNNNPSPELDATATRSCTSINNNNKGSTSKPDQWHIITICAKKQNKKIGTNLMKAAQYLILTHEEEEYRENQRLESTTNNRYNSSSSNKKQRDAVSTINSHPTFRSIYLNCDISVIKFFKKMNFELIEQQQSTTSKSGKSPLESFLLMQGLIYKFNFD